MKFSLTDYAYPASAGSYRIDPRRRLRIEEYRGKVGLADLKDIVRAVVSDPDWSPDLNGLVDFTKAELELSANDVLRLALMLRQEQNRSRGWVVFAVSNSVAFGVVRMLGYWARCTERFRIFNSREEAEKWLERHHGNSPPAFREAALCPA
ncbi:MAG: hypothetical protein EHM17_12845 [Verrucomicrobiaceae bacterium]|nr:MAG: hypothetical protein EHM17_12845 [Verrucomicrobiaceae bacterium]